MKASDLIRIYRLAFDKLLKRLSKLPAEQRNSLMDEIANEVNQTMRVLDLASADFVHEVLPKMYEVAEQHAIDVLQGGNVGSSLNRRELQLLAENTADQLTEANHLFGRRTMDTVRDIDMKVVSEGLVGSRDTPNEIKKKLVEELESEGMQFVPSSDGRQMDLRSYSEMVARTTPREAANLGSIETTKQLGHDLVKCTETATCCAICGALMGRIFSISGEDTRFPALSEVHGFNKGFHTIHPNCKHSFVPVVWDLLTDEEQAEALAKASQALDYDQRTAAQIEAYNSKQAEKRKLWQDKRQWVKYKIALGKDIPKTLSDFRKMKADDPDTWKKLQQKRKLRRESEKTGTLPNGFKASTAESKLKDYALNPAHPVGGSKAAVYDAVLGYNQSNWEKFADVIYTNIPISPARNKRHTEYGTKYDVPMVVKGVTGCYMRIDVTFQVDKGSSVPRIITVVPG